MQKIFQVQNTEKLEISYYKKFYFIIVLVLTGVLIFLCWSLKQGSGEHNLGSWLIYIIIPSAIKTVLIFVGLGLALKFIFNKIFKESLKKPILSAVLGTMFITLFLGYFITPIFSIGELSNSIFYMSGIILIGAPAILIVILIKIFRIPAPDFWRLNLGPAIIIYSLVMMILPFILAGTNYIFTKSMVCNFVSSRLPQVSCYRTKAIKTNNINLCREKKLDQFIKGDCIIAIAAYRKDISLCELPEVKNNSNSYNFCLSTVSDNL